MQCGFGWLFIELYLVFLGFPLFLWTTDHWIILFCSSDLLIFMLSFIVFFLSFTSMWSLYSWYSCFLWNLFRDLFYNLFRVFFLFVGWELFVHVTKYNDYVNIAGRCISCGAIWKISFRSSSWRSLGCSLWWRCTYVYKSQIFLLLFWSKFVWKYFISSSSQEEFVWFSSGYNIFFLKQETSLFIMVMKWD